MDKMVERVAAVFREANESGAQFRYEDVARKAIEAIEQEAMIIAPYGKGIWHGEGADEEFELVPTSRQRVYEAAINELKRRLGE
jgi:hypothetical protein